MAGCMGSILRKITRDKKEPLNILTFVTHERYEPNLCLTGHNFYSITGNGIRGWNKKVSPIPDNYHIINVGDNLQPYNIIYSLPMEVDIDCIIAQNRFAHTQIARHLQTYLQVPIISIEHTDTMPNWPEQYIAQLSKMSGDINVFISDYNKERWMSTDGYVIEHMVDTDIFTPQYGKRNNVILSMCNDWINRDLPCGFSVWQRVSNGLPRVVVGETPGLSRGSNSLGECISTLQGSRIFFNTSQFSPVPMSLLEAMSCGCAIVSSATCMIPEIIENGVNGFISNDESKLREYLELLLNNEELANTLGNAARETIKKRFTKEKFISGWNEVFDEIRTDN